MPNEEQQLDICAVNLEQELVAKHSAKSLTHVQIPVNTRHCHEEEAPANIRNSVILDNDDLELLNLSEGHDINHL